MRTCTVCKEPLHGDPQEVDLCDEHEGVIAYHFGDDFDATCIECAVKDTTRFGDPFYYTAITSVSVLRAGECCERCGLQLKA